MYHDTIVISLNRSFMGLSVYREIDIMKILFLFL